MVGATVAVLNDHKNIWGSTPAFVKAVDALMAKMQAIQTETGKQATPTTGVAVTKAHVRDALEDTALEIADQLSALAESAQNAELAAQVEITRSALDKLSDEELEATAKRIASLAARHIAPLADYLVSQSDIDGLVQLIGEFSAIKTAPRVAVVERASSTNALPELLSETSRILRSQIDKMVSRFRNTHPGFVAKYRAARVIIDLTGPAKAKEPATPGTARA